MHQRHTSKWAQALATGVATVTLAGLAQAQQLTQVQAQAPNYPAPVEGSWTVRDFRFHSGRVLPELTLHYRTVGDPSGLPVLILHGTAGSGQRMLTPEFAGQLFGPGQPLDATRHYLILPDAIGAGKSSKPSDGLRTQFPAYNYDDMVRAQYRLVTEHLKVPHLRLVMGNSMGGMHTWRWGQQYPDFMDALVPMASLPMPMSGRNWVMRRLLIDGIRNDPDYANGQYTQQPRQLQHAMAWFNMLSSGGNLAWAQQAPTRDKADALIRQRLDTPVTADANDLLYQWQSSGDFDPGPQLGRIRAPLLAINAADDERNPPELGVLEQALAQLPKAQAFVIPASADTRGHATTGSARHYAAQLQAFLDSLPPPAPAALTHRRRGGRCGFSLPMPTA